MRTDGLIGWIQSNIIPLLIIIVGVVVLNKSRQGNISQIVTIVAGVLVGLTIIALAAPGVAAAIGSWVVGLIQG